MKIRLAAVLLFISACLSAGAADKTNVLLIISDDLRTAINCYGDKGAKTPNIDRLAARGVRFDRAYVQYPVCNPSRVSFLTGMRCEQTGVVQNTVMFRDRLPNVITLPQLLRQNGWHAASFGKVFHAGESRGEVRSGWMDEEKSWDEAKMFDFTPVGKVRVEGRNLTDGKLKWCEWGAMAGTDDDQADGQTAQHAVGALERLSAGNKPWLVAAGFNRPHDPFLVPAKYFDLYPTGTLNIYRDPADASPLKPLSIGGGAFVEAFEQFTDVERLEFLRAYYAGVSFTDAQVGRLLDTMDRLKLWENTVVIFMGDHGYHLNERNYWNKNTLFERSCRVPFIVASPDAKAGSVCSALVEMVDLYPTIADYCGTKLHEGLAGQSLRPLLKLPKAKGRDAAFTMVARGEHYGQAVRTDRWRYIQWSDGTSELYDQDKDPDETRDLAGDAQHAGTVKSLKQNLEKVGPFTRSGNNGTSETRKRRKE